MGVNQKPRKPIMFTANSKNTQGDRQPTTESMCYKLP